jgi:hypothetical protein
VNSPGRAFRKLALAALLLAPVALSAAAECVAEFDTFITHFEADAAFQRRNTVYPLAISSVDSAVRPGARTIARTITRKEAAMRDDLLFPDLQKQQAIPLVRAMQCGVSTACVVSFDKADSDAYSIRFSFGLRRSCWRLVGVASISL